ncbi:hypothetical protein Tco_1315319 [Tanacetum coccineum]
MDGQTSPRNYQYIGPPQKGLYPKGPIPGMRPTQALTAIQTMADHSQKWHDGTTSKNIGSIPSKDGLAALVNKLDNLGRDMKKLKESIHAIQVGCQICEGPRLDRDYPVSKEVKQVKEIGIRAKVIENQVKTSDEELEEPIEDQPLPADASPTALSSGYIVDSDLEEDEEDPKEDPADHPVDGRDNDDNESSDDDEDDDDVEKDEEDEEEHLALADPSVVPTDDLVPSS